MIQITQLKLAVGHSKTALEEKVEKILRINKSQIKDIRIIRRSIDGRKKPDIFWIYTLHVRAEKEKSIIARIKSTNVTLVSKQEYAFPKKGEQPLETRPIIVGSGPAGLFCAYMLAINGYRPVLFERGACVDERTEHVQKFWEEGILNEESNVQFGEGGAGTFSDGKLNTSIKDPNGRNRKILELFVQYGAPEDILYESKPHIGTDILSQVVKNLRTAIKEYGGEVHFNSKMTEIHIQDGEIDSITIQHRKVEGNSSSSCSVEKFPHFIKRYQTKVLILAIGHSARDTFEMLHEAEIPMEAKAFAVGIRIEHPQSMIDISQYGQASSDSLPVASYKLTTQTKEKKGVYSFCMCPGGYVVNASSEKQHLAVNGMSYHKRDGANANSAIIVTVSPEDYHFAHPLDGIKFQRNLERKAYQLADGNIPIQLFEDFCKGNTSMTLREVIPQTKGSYQFANLREIFPDHIVSALCEAIKVFDKKIHGFARKDAILSGVESRTSSPVRLVRNQNLQSEIHGLYPCGEGAGYAGGITSAAADGIKVAESVASRYKPFD